MEIRDPVHGSIHILDEEIPIIQNNFFQRLRNIKQLGFSEYVFPGATHTRFIHSIGVMHIGTLAFDRLFSSKLCNIEVQRLRETFRLACLLHDIGHAPLSHSTETVMPALLDLQIPVQFQGGKVADSRQATHEDYTIKAIVDSSLAAAFELVKNKFGVENQRIAELIVGQSLDDAYYTLDGINYFPLLFQLISSELDCDRMDYLLRDSYFCGVSYGNFDLDWMLDNLDVCVIDNQAYLGISERAVVTFDDFLLSRYHMFLMVYFHYRSVCLEQLLLKYFTAAPNEYCIPANIEEYLEHDDHFLMKALRASSNRYAESIVSNQIPTKIFESFNESQLVTLEAVQDYLSGQNIEYIRCSSTGRLSKYYQHGVQQSNKYLIKVIRNFYGKGQRLYLDINEATDLFFKFSSSHAVNRLHCNLNLLSVAQRNDVLELIGNTFEGS
ncbi:MAG: HD domain-containing protein [Bacteriovoracaceae bacterium]|nr:HD domain-containing protein [Bacteriovoracaceae bacterium]